MPRQRSKKETPKDLNELAAHILEESTKEKPSDNKVRAKLTPHSHSIHKVKER